MEGLACALVGSQEAETMGAENDEQDDTQTLLLRFFEMGTVEGLAEESYANTYAAADEESQIHAHTDTHESNSHMDDDWHLIQDFDRIQYEYLKCCEQLQLHKQSYEFSTFDTDQKKFEIFDHLAKAYIYGPLIKDNYYRTLNADIFQCYDDDPFNFLLSPQEEQEFQKEMSGPYNPQSRYPKLHVMLMNSEENRQKRRRAMLSALCSKSSFVAPQGGASTAWDVEVDRISNLLGESLNRDHQLTQQQEKPWFFRKFPWLHESREERTLRHAQAVGPKAFDQVGGYF
eukprot:CAMPEP_0117453640 /NCGR_PEP_ID=MMETSP0759-20121206/10336_1 /TAXON_ID=63605 /ORGANISM="Percolomonas cosmopolitus, Strain WS" /LENGTH=286 /DNA_ID=CAMNT_0005246695 /DNA_START=359 /DNA_END=1220 /DNA_ORIENTATION=-